MSRFPTFRTLILLIIAIWYCLYQQMPNTTIDATQSPDTFDTSRALSHVKALTTAPHFAGNTAHNSAQKYLVNALKKMGITAEIQKGVAIGKAGSISHPENIVARIKGSGNGKALLLLAHYDSHPHSSYGASDDASGIATILESVRAFLNTTPTPKNDLIILFTDGEELGLHGARLFVDNHPWAKDIGLALNFEARGSGGPSFMLVETATKNSELIKEFIKADVPYPVANSLAYSIYKLMPNDTDLTIFREQGAIDGLNFAFIDDHYDYHTANDTWDRLDTNTLQHQGSYLMALLPHFANTALDSFKSEQDLIYFNIPVFKMLSYPFSWRYPLLSIAILLFIGLLFYGFKENRLELRQMTYGLIPLLVTLFIVGGSSFLTWKLLQYVYPHYKEILQGFPYNGHYYIWAFVFWSIAVCFWIYNRFVGSKNGINFFIAPLFFWLIIATVAAVYLPGASYLVIIVYFGLLNLFLWIRQERPLGYLLVMLGLPAIYLLTPFVRDFPIALGLHLLVLSTLLCVVLFYIVQPLFHFYSHKKTGAYIALLVAIVFLCKAHLRSDFSSERKKPNSLVYIADLEDKNAAWATYDHVLDSWTKNYIKPDIKNTKAPQTAFYSKYGTSFSHTTAAPYKVITAPRIEISKDTIIQNDRIITLCITPQRSVHRYDLFVDKRFNFKKLMANGATAKDFIYQNDKTYNAYTKRWDDRLLTYYPTRNTPLELELHIQKDEMPEIMLYESSFDLLNNKHFTVPKRPEDMMPKPFVLNDAIVLKKKLIL